MRASSSRRHASTRRDAARRLALSGVASRDAAQRLALSGVARRRSTPGVEWRRVALSGMTWRRAARANTVMSSVDSLPG
eukprot:2911258-Pyramimonas_sp.AAC.1